VSEIQYASPAVGFPVFYLPSKNMAVDIIVSEFYIQEVHVKKSSSSRKTVQASSQIIKSLRLEKTSKITKSNHQPNTTTPAKPCPEVPHLHVF